VLTEAQKRTPLSQVYVDPDTADADSDPYFQVVPVIVGRRSDLLML
jgi:hypothetical protein